MLQILRRKRAKSSARKHQQQQAHWYTGAQQPPVREDSEERVLRRRSLPEILDLGGEGAAMGKVGRVLVVGARKVGKTAILHQIALGRDATADPYEATIDDTYSVLLDGDKGNKDILVFHDTAGLEPSFSPAEIKRPYLQIAEAYILVYSILDAESFHRVDLLKKFLDKNPTKDKKEVPIVVLGNKSDMVGSKIRQVDLEFAQAWSQREKVKLYEVTATERNCLVEPILHLSSRLFQPKESKSHNLSSKKKEKAAIFMDF